MKKKSLIIYFIILQIFFCGLLVVTFNPIIASSSSSNDYGLRSSAVNFSNATVVSDGFDGTYWNDGSSYKPTIAIDSNGKVHVVWHDNTNGAWGTDAEIMYATYTISLGWSNATVISDGYDGSYWNNGGSYDPVIAIDSSDKVHVVWEDDTNGVWGTDYEIMYATFTESTGWSNVTVISDGLNDIYWNDDSSYNPSIAIDDGDKVHVVWADNTNGAWGTDYEIMYATYTDSIGWSVVKIISDGYDGIYSFDGSSDNPEIAVDGSDKVHVVWQDYTDGVWGTDTEIMYVYFTSDLGWSNATVISDGPNDIYWNDGSSLDPVIAIDSSDEVHVVWEDETNGAWGTDTEIMYTAYNSVTGWSLARIISDGYNGSYWNDGHSLDPAIAVDSSDNVHVVWKDYTDGVWWIDDEVMYANFTEINNWSNITVLSDGYNGDYWNTGVSTNPTIAISINQVHVVWDDETNGVWGTDREIMYANFAIPAPPAPPVDNGPGGIPFGNFYLLFIAVSIIGLVAYKKRKI